MAKDLLAKLAKTIGKAALNKPAKTEGILPTTGGIRPVDSIGSTRRVREGVLSRMEAYDQGSHIRKTYNQSGGDVDAAAPTPIETPKKPSLTDQVKEIIQERAIDALKNTKKEPASKSKETKSSSNYFADLFGM